MLAKELQSILQETGNQYRKHLFQKLPLSRVRAILTSRPTRPTVSPKILKANTCSNKAELWPLINSTRIVSSVVLYVKPSCRFLPAHLNFWLSLHKLHEHYAKGIERKETV